MKKRIFIYIAFVLLGLMPAGCMHDSYRGLVDVTDTGDNVEPQRVVMFVGKSNEMTEYDLKGSGVIGTVEGLEGKNFYIYSFLKGNIDVPYSDKAADDNHSCLIDASLDDPESLAGRKVFWNSESGIIEWAQEGDHLYYPIGDARSLTYDFFAYYIDDDMVLTNENVHRKQNSVVIDVEIDGSQDVMSAYARPTEEELVQNTETPEEVSHRERCSYSHYTASLNIHPRFVFKHHLTKLDFKLVPGGTPGTTKDVMVEKIEVYTRTKGKFTVADKNPDNLRIAFGPDYDYLFLKEKDGGEFVPRLVTTLSSGEVTDGVIDDLGSLLVAPDEKYEIYVTLSETREDGVVSEGERNRLEVYLGKTPGEDEGDDDRDDGGDFSAGNEYLITLTIYGKMDVRVGTELLDWDEGGDYGYDYDEEHWKDN